ncbi:MULTISPECIES: molybdopterin oxidoreductase family protein [Sorangium]|uniref:Dehydrogenase n=1 Tax=Sorangium cellulosum TaxID=56 RepID=A0A4P2QMR4_SORCE|nr:MULTISPECIES: molybdopterin oxidoreductase family protein [Sorangium]AUX30803.1 dehydrogenase [Sorangium cellulosum]WCQ90184.1 Polysulfide reductase chain A [Sorangium sp. Soce836]
MPSHGTTRTHHRTCNICEAMCGIDIEVDGDRITSIRGDERDPFSRGYICPKALALQDLHEDEDRLRTPVRRTASGFQRISWDDALDEVAGRLRDTQRRHGRDAVAVYMGNPRAHNYASLLYLNPFLEALRTRSCFSSNSVDQLPHHLVSTLLFGHQLLVPVPDIDRTSFLLIVGANPVVSNGSLMSAPGMPRRLKAIRARGGTIVVVDPRRTETAEIADRHHFIRPGTDVFLMLGLLSTLFAERLVAPGRLGDFMNGLADIERLVRDFTPERVAARVGIPAAQIRELARAFAAARPAVCYGRIGACLQEFGALTTWLIAVLSLVTGNLDRPGGAMFARPAVDVVAIQDLLGQRGDFGRSRSRVRQLPAFAGEYPAAALAEEILTEGLGQIRALLTMAGNPVLSTPNGRALDRALAGLDFMASIDFYINETTRHAHVILPPTGPLERDHYDLAFHAFAVRNTAKYAPALFAPADGARHDWQILVELGARLAAPGPAAPLAGRAARLLSRALPPTRLLDAALRFGPYGAGVSPLSGGLSLRRLEREPHGVDLGPLVPCLPQRLFTRSGRIELAPEALVADLERARGALGREERGALGQEERGALGRAAGGAGEAGEPGQRGEAGYDLQLIGRRQLRSNNSWLHNSRRLVKGRNRCTLLMHPEDAAHRGIAAGQRIRVCSRVGSIDLEVELTDEVMPGVVSAPHGWGHGRDGVRLETARRHAGESVNDLTDDLAIDALSGTAALNGVPVRVEPAGAAPA